MRHFRPQSSGLAACGVLQTFLNFVLAFLAVFDDKCGGPVPHPASVGTGRTTQKYWLMLTRLVNLVTGLDLGANGSASRRPVSPCSPIGDSENHRSENTLSPPSGCWPRYFRSALANQPLHSVRPSPAGASCPVEPMSTPVTAVALERTRSSRPSPAAPGHEDGRQHRMRSVGSIGEPLAIAVHAESGALGQRLKGVCLHDNRDELRLCRVAAAASKFCLLKQWMPTFNLKPQPKPNP